MTETIGPAESKICIIQPFKEMFVNLLFRESQILNLAHHIDELYMSNQGRNKESAGISKLSRLYLLL